MSIDTNNYTLGRGQLFFNKFAAGTLTPEFGERYLGNSPSISGTRAQGTLDHYDSDHGLREKDAQATLNDDLSLSFTLDEINDENLAMWYLGTAGVETDTLVTARTQELTIRLGDYYQLSSPNDPAGANNITDVVMTTDGSPSTTITASGNYIADLETGRIYVSPTAAALNDGDIVTVTYNIAAGVRNRIISGRDPLVGSLRYLADNARGPNRNQVWPYVVLRPDGEYQLKGDDWQTLGFVCEVLKKANAQRYAATLIPA